MRPKKINLKVAADVSASQIVDIGSHLFVPMHLSALVVAEQNDDMQWASMAPEYKELNNPALLPVGENIQTGICENPVADLIHKPGVHLHWVLPDAYRSGVQQKGDTSPVFPLAPNRWLVTRFSETDGKASVKRWIVESDYVEEKSDEPNWLAVNRNTSSLLQPGDLYSTLKIGRQIVYEDWVEQQQGGNAAPFVTIMAPGDSYFAASYTSSQNVFGFHDRMVNKDGEDEIDEPSGTYHYAVMGWLSDPSKGILAGVKDSEEWIDKLNSLTWKVNDIDKTNVLPGSIVCHAMVNNVEWDRNSITESGRPAKDIKVAVGNTVAEALAALISQVRDREGDAVFRQGLDPYLSAMQYNILMDHVADKGRNILNKLEATDGPGVGTRAMQNNSHSKSFRAINGGVLWQVARKEKRNDADEGTNEPKQNEIVEPMQPETAKQLVALNKCERDFDDSLAKLLSAQERAYSNWYTKKVIKSGEHKNGLLHGLSAGEKTLLLSELDKEGEHILQMMKSLSGNGTLATTAGLQSKFGRARKGAQTDLEKAMANDPAYADFEIKEAKLPPYHLPNDPTVVIDGLQPSPIYLRSKVVTCRLEDQLVNGLNFDRAGNLQHVVVSYEKILRDYPALAYEKAPAIARELMKENMAFCPAMATAAAKLACGNKCSEADREDLIEELRGIAQKQDEHKEKFVNEKTAKAVMPEAFSVHYRESQPWIPIIMEWEVEWYATPSKDLLKNWEFGATTKNVKLNNIDYTLRGSANSGPVADTFKGRVALSSDLGEKLRDLNSSIGNGSLFTGMSPMHQSLSGLDRHFLKQNSTIQLPPLSRPASGNLLTEDDSLPVDKIIEGVGDQYLWSPSSSTKGFYPLRGGTFKIKNLFIIDAFGQNLPVIRSEESKLLKLHVSASLTAGSDDLNIVLPPRICQPARMHFKWMSATTPDKETDSNPGTSPLCGWMMHNKLDESIMFFDANGTALRSTRVVNNKVVAEDPPGPSTPKLLTANQGMNDYLKMIVEMLDRGGPDTFTELVRQMGEMADKAIKAKKKSGTVASLPFGVPMAVVHAACALELNALPAKPDMPTLLKDDGSLTTTEFPFYVGSTLSRNDGVIAVYHDAQPDVLTMPFAQFIPKANDHFATDNPLRLSLGAELSGPTTDMTLIVHPYMDVTIASGILPSATYQLPDLNANKAMEKINLSFLVNPFLIVDDVSNTKKKPSIPVPDITGKKWEWLQQHYVPATKATTWDIAELDSRKNLLIDFDKPVVIKEGWLKLEQKEDNKTTY